MTSFDWRASGVRPWRRRALKLQEGLARVQVVPAAHVVGWAGDLTEPLLDVQRLPVLVVMRVIDPVLPLRQVLTDRLVHIPQRQCPQRRTPLVRLEPGLPRVDGVLERPGEGHAELERAERPEELAVLIGADDPGDHTGQELTPLRRGNPLGQAEIRGAARADLAGRPRLLADPLLNIVAVLRFGEVGVVLAAPRVVTAADVDGDESVALACIRLAELGLGAVVIRRADEHRGNGPAASGR